MADASITVPTTGANSSTSTKMELTSLSTGIFVFLVVIWSLFGARVSARCQYLGEGSTACILGLFTGLVLLIATLPKHDNPLDVAMEEDLLSFSSAAFFTYLLPPVIFYAGISVEKKRFFRNLPSILSYGVLGTFICFLILVTFLFTFTSLTLQDILALGAIFSATDSVATLQILEHHPNPLLFSLVFGEGVINDATSVVLLRAVTHGCRGQCPGMSWHLAGHILGSFVYLFCTSFLLGGATGLGVSLAMKWAHLKGPHQEVSLIGLLAYLGYLLAELLGLSGILSLFCCGLVVSHYALHTCSPEGQATTLNTFRALSYMSEGLIFVYVGMDALDPKKWREANRGQAMWLFAVLVVGLMISRAAFVVPVSLGHNRWSREQLSTRDIVVIWWAGLIRGAVSVALAYYQFDTAGSEAGPQRSTLIVTTLAVVLVSILLFGALTKPLMQLLLRESDESLMLRLTVLRRKASSRLLRHQPRWLAHLGGGGYKKVYSEGDLDFCQGDRGDSPGAPRTPPRAQRLGPVGWREVGAEGSSPEARAFGSKSRSGGAWRGGDEEGVDQDVEDVDAGWKSYHATTSCPTPPPTHVSDLDLPPSTPEPGPSPPHRPNPITPARLPAAAPFPDPHLRAPLEVEPPLEITSEAAPLISAGRTQSQDAEPPLIAQVWSRFDQQFMRPVFGGSGPPSPDVGHSSRIRDSIIERRGLD